MKIEDVPVRRNKQEQGQGGTTEWKERGILAALALNLKLCTHPAKFHSRFNYWHLDLHSGSGWNEEVNCVGSPLAFLEVIRDFPDKRYQAFFCDHNPQLIDQLRVRPEIAMNGRCYVFCKENREILPVFAAAIRSSGDKPRYAMGSILVDPNGCCFGDAVPMQELQTFCREFPRIDILVNFNLRTWRMIRGCIDKGMKGFLGRTCPAPSDLRTLFKKEHCLIRDTLIRGGDPFIFWIGRNYPMGEHPALGFFSLDSPRGQLILRRIEQPEIMKQEALRAQDSFAYPD